MRRVGVQANIECSPDVRSGRPCVSGTGVRVQDIVASYEFQGQSPDQVAAGYPHLTLAGVHAALAYYYEHAQEIRQDMAADEEFVSAFHRDGAQSLVNRLPRDVDSHPS